MSNIRTLWSDKKDDDKKKEGVEEFSQGGHQSSTAVLRPVKRDVTANDIIGVARSSAANAGGEQKLDSGLTLTMYRNGFLIGDNDWRPISENQEFLRTLQKGEVPAELEREIVAKYGPQVQEVGVSVVNKATEDYTPPPKPFDFANSKGQSLGDDATSESSASTSNFSSLSPKRYEADSSKPTITVQLVILPRERVRVTFNTTATVGDVYRHMRFLSNIDNFQMLVGFPPSPLTDPNQNVVDAKLANASVQQRA